MNLIEYYRNGAECHPICRNRESGCPCTETAKEIERLRKALLNSASALSYYAAPDYLPESDVQAGCAIEALDEIEAELKKGEGNE